MIEVSRDYESHCKTCELEKGPSGSKGLDNPKTTIQNTNFCKSYVKKIQARKLLRVKEAIQGMMDGYVNPMVLKLSDRTNKVTELKLSEEESSENGEHIIDNDLLDQVIFV